MQLADVLLASPDPSQQRAELLSDSALFSIIGTNASDSGPGCMINALHDL